MKSLTNEQIEAMVWMATAYLPSADQALEWELRDHDNDGDLDVGCRLPDGEWQWLSLPRVMDREFAQRNVHEVMEVLRFTVRGLPPPSRGA